jgi:hypothetical protein
MNLIDFLRMGGQERRNMLDNYVDDLNLERFLPPNLRPAGQFVNEMNPVNAMGSAMQDASVAFDPNQTNAARLAAARDMGFEMAMTLAPAALVRMGYLTAPAGLAETFGMSVDNAAENARGLISDATYAARSVAEGDPRGVIQAFQRSGTPQSVSAASIGDNGGPPLDVVPARAELFSPSLRAAENLKQNKGTYEQMRGMLLKGGGKEAELEWSGMDRTFAGQKVTKEDLISYLRKYDPRLDQETVSATVNPNAPQIPAGAVARSDFDFDEWFENNVMADQPLISEETNYLVDNLSADLTYTRDDVAYGPDLDEEQAQALADATGEDVDDLMNAEYIIETGEDSVLLTDDPYDAVMAVYGEDAIEEMVRDGLYENYEYRYNYETSDFENQTGLQFYDDPEDFGTQGVMEEGDTRYSAYMPAGFRSYDENFYTYSDPTMQYHDDYIAGASHFGQNDAQTQYHTRVGDYQTSNTVGGRPFNARYVAEIQSDAQQAARSRDKTPMTYEQGVDLTRQRQAILPFKNAEQIAIEELNEANRDFNRSISEILLQDIEGDGSYFEMAAKVNKLNRAIGSHRRSALAKGPNGTEPFPLFGSNDMPPMDDLVIDWENATDAELSQIYQDYNLSEVRAFDEDRMEVIKDEKLFADLKLPDAVRAKAIDALSNVEAAKVRKKEAQQAIYDKEMELESQWMQKHNSLPHQLNRSGPMMASQNRWVDDAIRRSIIDAVNDENIDFLAFPKDEQAIGKVGGTDYPKDGTIDFYNRDVQNRLRNIVRKIDKDARIQEIGLESPMRREGEFPAYGLRITPDFRRRVIEQGLPTFAALGAVPLMGVIDYLKEQKEKRNERFGGLMGYGGL